MYFLEFYKLFTYILIFANKDPYNAQNRSVANDVEEDPVVSGAAFNLHLYGKSPLAGAKSYSLTYADSIPFIWTIRVDCARQLLPQIHTTLNSFTLTSNLIPYCIEVLNS